MIIFSSDDLVTREVERYFMMEIETSFNSNSLAFFGIGRLDSNYNAEWSWGGTGSVATRTAVSTMPLPAAVWLFTLGFLGLIGLCKRKV